MGKGSSTSTQTVKQEQSPEQKAITQAAMGTYMPDGKLADRPQFNPAEHSWMGEQKTAGFNSDQLAAFDATRASAFEHRPAMEAATNMAIAGAGPTGQEQALGTGWSTDENGRAKFADFNADTIGQFMSPYTDNVINDGLAQLTRLNDIAQLKTNDAAAAAGAFGGSRHGVANANTNEGYARTAQSFLADTLNTGYDKAVGQYNKERDEGQEALSWNKGVQDDNMTRLSNASTQVANLAEKNQDLNGKGINALGAIGDIQQQRDQTVLDTSAAELEKNFLWQAQLGQMLSGFTPAPTTTQTSSSNSGGSIWGSIGSAALGTALKAAIPAMMSDEDAKENVEEADPEDSLEEIRRLAERGLFNYEYTDDAKSHGAPEGKRVGFMAQDLEKATGEASPEAAGGYKGVDIAQMLGRLTHAVAALDRKLEEREAA